MPQATDRGVNAPEILSVHSETERQEKKKRPVKQCVRSGEPSGRKAEGWLPGAKDSE